MSSGAGPSVSTEGLLWALDYASPKAFEGPTFTNLWGSANDSTNTEHPSNKPFERSNHSNSIEVSTEVPPPYPGLDVYKITDSGADAQNQRYAIKVDTTNTWVSYDTDYVWSFYVYLPTIFKNRYTSTTHAVYQNTSGTDWHSATGYQATFDYYGAGSITTGTVNNADISKVGEWQRVSVALKPLASNVNLAVNNGLDDNKWIAGYYRINVSNAINGTGFPWYLYLSGGQFETGTQPTRFHPDGRTNFYDQIKDWKNKTSITSTGEITFDRVEDIYEFDGVNDYLTITDKSYPASWSDPYSIEAWVKIPSGADWHDQATFGSNSATCIVARGGYGGSHGLGRRDTNILEHITRTDSGLFRAAFSGALNDTWYHVMGTWDGVSANKIYINGVLQTTTTVTVTGVPDSGNWRIGGNMAFGGNNGGYGRGEIGQARLYNRELSSSEVQRQYRATKGLFGL